MRCKIWVLEYETKDGQKWSANVAAFNAGDLYRHIARFHGGMPNLQGHGDPIESTIINRRMIGYANDGAIPENDPTAVKQGEVLYLKPINDFNVYT